MIELFCKLCGEPYEAVNEIPNVCPDCHKETSWSTTAPVRSIPPKDPYKLTFNDREFLKKIPITPEE